MKNAFISLTLAAIICGAGTAKAETFYVVETTDLQKKSTYDVMNAEKKSELQRTVAAEARVYSKALEAVRQNWDSADKPAAGEKPVAGTHAAAPQPFPNGMLAPRRVVDMGGFFDEKTANKKRDALENHAMDEQKKAEDVQKKKNDAIKDKNKQAAKIARDQELVSAAQQAAASLQAKIDELVTGTAAVAPAAPAPAAGGANAAPAGGTGDGKPAAAAPAAKK